AKYETKNIAWMTKLPGFSASSPVVAGDRLFATCGTSELVCVDKRTGRVLWLTTCTPCDAMSDEDKAAPAYQQTVEPLAARLDGRRAWSFHESLGAGEHGTHVSPQLVDGKLIYAPITTILAFDPPTGKVAWRDRLPQDAENCVGCMFVPARIGDAAVLVVYPN